MRRRRYVQLRARRQQHRNALQGSIGKRGMHGMPLRGNGFRARQLGDTTGRADAHTLDALKCRTVRKSHGRQSLVDVLTVEHPVVRRPRRHVDPLGPQIRLDQPPVGMCRPQLGVRGSAVDGEPLGRFIHGDARDRGVMVGDHQRHREHHRIQARLSPARALTDRGQRGVQVRGAGQHHRAQHRMVG
ncbi:Uncharacterised protein [Mycobacteroides abscessus]|nr:Uncharacterised protein [Mycobacteroides abscessus]SIN33158.1 Uncharacterised protein [Mycobacteroides abscessus subsp. bolletii]SLD06841.1 Uncharacterised protein [Mycobacteroides abscessus subsp. massiliense]